MLRRSPVRNRVVLCCIAVVALVAHAGRSQEVLWELEDSGKVDRAVIEKLSAEARTADLSAGEPRVRVVVLFAPPAVQGRELDRTSPAGKAAVAAATDRILRSIPPGEFALKRRYRTVNAVAVESTARGLLAVLGQRDVLSIDLDEGGEGHLNEARPLVGIDAVRTIYGHTGNGLTAAVIDSGVDTDHDDLQQDVIGQACFCTDCCPNGGSTQFGPGSAEDDHGHGTNVTGIITSSGTIAPLGGAPDVKIVAVKVLDSNNTFCCTSDVIAALDWIVDGGANIDLVNLSLGTFKLHSGDCDKKGTSNKALAAAIDALRARDVVVFASSGNAASDNKMSSPACIANTISVGAVYDASFGFLNFSSCTDTGVVADQVTCFTNVSSTTDLVAPGARTTSTGLFNGISSFFGTSQASPLALSCAALLKDERPNLTADEIETALESTNVFVVDDSNGRILPRLDCLQAVMSVAN